jgi:hypothetical protein
MLIFRRPRQLVGKRHVPYGRRGQRRFVAARRDLRGGVGRFVGCPSIITVFAVGQSQPALLVFDFGQAQSILKVETDLGGRGSVSSAILFP